MIEKGKISALQMAILLHLTIVTTAVLLVPGITFHHAKQDMWLSPILASSVGFLSLFIAYWLHKLYPEKTPIQYFGKIIGRVPGKLIGLAFLLFYLHLDGIVLREYSEFVKGTFLTRTPMIVIIGTMALFCAFAVRGGLEALARSAQLFIPVVLLLFFVIILMLTPDMDPRHMLPFMENGIWPSIKGAITPQSWFSEYFTFAFMLPFLTDKTKALKWGNISVLSVMVIMIICNITALFIFGDITARFTYPTMSAARYISIADFLEHLESVIMAIWVLGVFVKISVFYYVLVLATAQWMNLSDYRPLVYPIGLLLVLVCIWSATSLQELSHFLGSSSTAYLTFVQTVIPFSLLIIAWIRKGVGKNESNK